LGFPDRICSYGDNHGLADRIGARRVVLAGFGITIISPQIFGAVLDTTNKGNPALTVWGPAFAVLAAGPIIGLILLAVLRRHPKAILMAGGRK